MYDPYAQQYGAYGAAPPNYPPDYQYPPAAADPYGGYGAPPANYPPVAGYGAPQQYGAYGAPPTDYPPMNPQYAVPQPAAAAPYAQPGGGRRKALLIGINYIRTPRAKLSGCINDAINLRYYLLTHGFDAASIVVLTDDATDASLYPSRANIIAQMRNLVAGVQPGDSLWFSFSGHGSQVADTSGDEADGMDETICPADYTTAGQIVDDDIYDMLVKPLPPGARMHAIMDCCHSGTGMDLPYVFDGTRIIGEASPQSQQQKYAGGKGKKDKKKGSRPQRLAQPPPQGHVVLFSGCMDTQTSADATGLADRKIATGALTYVWLDTINKNPGISYSEILSKMRTTLKAKGFTQIPQLSFNQSFDLNSPFSL